MAQSISEIKNKLFSDMVPSIDILNELKTDERKGVQQLLKQYERKQAKEQALINQREHMLQYERTYWNKGHEYVAGLDEAGCGPLAGPVVAAAVILPKGCTLLGIDDSKKLNDKKRKELADEIRKVALCWSVAQCSAQEVDYYNIYAAAKLSMQRAVESLTTPPSQLLIDARTVEMLPIPQESIVRGDSASMSIAAASILAKVARDTLMLEYDKRYPKYGFKNHMGYGTEAHMQALHRYGPCPIHRLSYRPVRLCAK